MSDAIRMVETHTLTERNNPLLGAFIDCFSDDGAKEVVGSTINWVCLTYPEMEETLRCEIVSTEEI